MSTGVIVAIIIGIALTVFFIWFMVMLWGLYRNIERYWSNEHENP